MTTMTPDEAAALQKLMDRGLVVAAEGEHMKFIVTVEISSPDVPEEEADLDSAVEEWLPEIPDTVYLGDNLYNLDIQGWQELPG